MPITTDIQIHAVNVLVIGSGAAGLRAAIAASDAGCEVLVVAKATALGAIARRETRGCHNRSDYPQLDETLTKTLEVSMDERELLVGSRALLEPAPELARLAALTPDLDPTGRLTE
ncbi:MULTISPECIES: FAD-binding protein [unclassified Nonomuraea]|uniref:FAD-binding protein n=1 Tax=unclassified Nonomuraea TaxID=2593643 RepID=UPI0033C1E432